MGRAFEFRKARKMKRWSAMSKAFTRIGKDIVMAVKEGGPNPDSNSRLRAVIQNAKAVNMPKDNVERAIKKATEKGQGDFKEVLFEGYAPHGIAILVETATDNNTRTVANVRACFSKCDGNMGTSGSVVFMFDHTCNFRINPEEVDLEELELELIDYGVEEVFEDEDGILIYAPFSVAFLIALSTLSLGILTAFAFWITARKRELESGLGPPSLTAITISFPMRVNALDIADQRFIFLAFLNSKALPIVILF
jgi:YebC/PmpR family DNA-binding regulatory protein